MGVLRESRRAAVSGRVFTGVGAVTIAAGIKDQLLFVVAVLLLVF